MLRVQGVHVAFKGKEILQDISLEVSQGQVCALIGPNGAGKSTLVRAISGLIRPERGQITINGRPLDNNRRRLARKLSYLPQNTTPVPCSVFDAILLGRKPHIHWRAGARDLRFAEKIMGEMGLAPLKDACVTRVSGGELQKVLIARALVQEAKVLVLDEPINHLDIKNQMEIMDLIRQLTKANGLATVIVLHDLNLALRHADSILLIREGRPLYCGDSAGISRQELSEAYDIPVSIRREDQAVHVLY